MVFVTRFLRPCDLPALLELERRQWTAQQAADEATLLARMQAWPQLCVGTFCSRSGRALASLFMKPVTRQQVVRACTWAECASISGSALETHSLFGISFTSLDAEAAWHVVRFFWPHALRGGWREIYLGSPIPGFRRAREREHGLDAERYARRRRAGLPRDPQLRYYHRKGFREIVAVREGYFPHEPSMDHAVVLRGQVPLSGLWPLWRFAPLPLLCSLVAEKPGPACGGVLRRACALVPAILRMSGGWFAYMLPQH